MAPADSSGAIAPRRKVPILLLILGLVGFPSLFSIYISFTAALSSVPLMALYFIAQRFMVSGLSEGSVKG